MILVYNYTTERVELFKKKQCLPVPGYKGVRAATIFGLHNVGHSVVLCVVSCCRGSVGRDSGSVGQHRPK